LFIVKLECVLLNPASVKLLTVLLC